MIVAEPDFPTDNNAMYLDKPARRARGERARRAVPLESLAECDSAPDRSPIDLLLKQAATRVPQLVPVRHGRMAGSPFAFFRGAALVMADDLFRAPSSGLITQLCGDAHLSNFGIFATPERKLAFDINDFDETYPGPFEWDVKRLAASLAVAARDNEFTSREHRRMTKECASEYREAMLQQAEQGNLAVWYSHIEPTTEMVELRDELDSSMKKRVRKLLGKSARNDSLQAAGKLTAVVDGRRTFISRPPLIVPIEEVFADADAAELYGELRRRIREYAATLQSDRRVLFVKF